MRAFVMEHASADIHLPLRIIVLVIRALGVNTHTLPPDLSRQDASNWQQTPTAHSIDTINVHCLIPSRLFEMNNLRKRRSFANIMHRSTIPCWKLRWCHAVWRKIVLRAHISCLAYLIAMGYSSSEGSAQHQWAQHKICSARKFCDISQPCNSSEWFASTLTSALNRIRKACMIARLTDENLVGSMVV